MHLTFDFFSAYKNMLIEIWVKFSVYLPLTCPLLQNTLSTVVILNLSCKVALNC